MWCARHVSPVRSHFEDRAGAKPVRAGVGTALRRCPVKIPLVACTSAVKWNLTLGKEACRYDQVTTRPCVLLLSLLLRGQSFCKVTQRDGGWRVFNRDVVMVPGQPFILGLHTRILGPCMCLLDHSSMVPKPVSDVCSVSDLANTISFLAWGCKHFCLCAAEVSQPSDSTTTER